MLTINSPVSSLTDPALPAQNECICNCVLVCVQQSSPLWRQQVDVFLSEILLKTNYKDLRRVEKAFLSFCKTKKQVDIEFFCIIFLFSAVDIINPRHGGCSVLAYSLCGDMTVISFCFAGS